MGTVRDAVATVMWGLRQQQAASQMEAGEDHSGLQVVPKETESAG